MNDMISDMLKFIDNSPTAFHTVNNVRDILIGAGFTELCEGERWKTEKGGKYFVLRNNSSLIAFEMGEDIAPFMICATHSDFPLFKVKEELSGVYTRLSTEKYGGLIMYSWFDRPLSVAGRAVVKDGNALSERLVNIDRDLLVIPSVAVHLQKNINDGFSPKANVDTLPLLTLGKKSLKEIVADELSVSESNIVSHDLFVYPREKGTLIGAENELILSPRIDNLECVYTSLMAFIDSDRSSATKVYALFDNEEVGSESKQGAASPFLSDTLERISKDRESYFASLAAGFMVSADNAHAKHPAHPELSDPIEAPLLSGGVVIKHNAGQHYSTEAVSGAIFASICERAGARVQHYSNRADLIGGSTLGSISNTKAPICTVDIGLPQLAMHSAVETAAVSDAYEMKKALTLFYSSSIEKSNGKIIVK